MLVHTHRWTQESDCGNATNRQHGIHVTEVGGEVILNAQTFTVPMIPEPIDAGDDLYNVKDTNITPAVAVPPPMEKTRKNQRNNTPFFPILNGAVFSRKCTSRGVDYTISLEKLCMTIAFSCNVLGKHNSTELSMQSSGEWVYRHGYFTDKEILRLGVMLSRQMSLVANVRGWGVDGNLWRNRPIFFPTNLKTDGLQWARQVERVCPQRQERHSWASLWMARTRGLHGDVVHKG